MPTKAINDVLDERERQIYGEKYSRIHDNGHINRELAQASSQYIHHYINSSCTFGSSPEEYRSEPVSNDWPWEPKWWKPKDPRRDLVRAAALLIAEIERLDRSSSL